MTKKKMPTRAGPRIDRVVTPPAKTFLLLGPRGTGKSTWLGQAFPQALVIDLLDSDRFLALSRDPASLAQLVAPLGVEKVSGLFSLRALVAILV